MELNKLKVICGTVAFLALVSCMTIVYIGSDPVFIELEMGPGWQEAISKLDNISSRYGHTSHTLNEIYENTEHCAEFFDAAERSRMTNRSIKRYLKVNGLYLDNQYYCVWTENRTYSDIVEDDPSLPSVNNTALHELAHDMIHKDNNSSNHFCSEYCKEVET